MNSASEEKLWDKHDVANYLGMSESWVYKAARRNELPCVRLGSRLRFVPDTIRKLGRGDSGSSSGQD